MAKWKGQQILSTEQLDKTNNHHQFRALEINQRHSTISEVFMLKKTADLWVRTVDVRGIPARDCFHCFPPNGCGGSTRARQAMKTDRYAAVVWRGSLICCSGWCPCPGALSIKVMTALPFKKYYRKPFRLKRSDINLNAQEEMKSTGNVWVNVKDSLIVFSSFLLLNSLKKT